MWWDALDAAWWEHGHTGDHAHIEHHMKSVRALCGRTKRDRQVGSLCFSQKGAQLCEQYLRHVAHACTDTRATCLDASTGRLVRPALNTGCMPDCPCNMRPQTVYHSVAEMEGFSQLQRALHYGSSLTFVNTMENMRQQGRYKRQRHIPEWATKALRGLVRLPSKEAGRNLTMSCQSLALNSPALHACKATESCQAVLGQSCDSDRLGPDTGPICIIALPWEIRCKQHDLQSYIQAPVTSCSQLPQKEGEHGVHGSCRTV